MTAREIAKSLKQAARDTMRNAAEAVGVRHFSKPGLHGLDDQLSRYLDFRDGFFIECGANDGYRQSNTYYLERFRGWSGLLIEPVPELHARCRKLRPDSICVQCALVAPDFPANEITIHYAGLMSVADGAFQDEECARQHVQEGLRLQGLTARELTVPAYTLSDLLDRTGIVRPIDFFSLDVEGFEKEVLNGIDFDRHRPRYILVEAREPEVVDQLLASYYRMIERLTHHDYLYSLC